MNTSIKILKHEYGENTNIKLNALSERKYSIYKFTNHFYDLKDIKLAQRSPHEGSLLFISGFPEVDIIALNLIKLSSWEAGSSIKDIMNILYH